MKENGYLSKDRNPQNALFLYVHTIVDGSAIRNVLHLLVLKHLNKTIIANFRPRIVFIREKRCKYNDS